MKSELLKILTVVFGFLITVGGSIFGAHITSVRVNTRQDERIKTLESDVKKLKNDMEKIASKSDLAQLREEVIKNADANTAAHNIMSEDSKKLLIAISTLTGEIRGYRNAKFTGK